MHDIFQQRSFNENSGWVNLYLLNSKFQNAILEMILDSKLMMTPEQKKRKNKNNPTGAPGLSTFYNKSEQQSLAKLAGL